MATTRGTSLGPPPASGGGSDAWRVKLFCCNTYQIAAPFVNKFNATCTDHDVRGERLGQMIRLERPDVVLLQEMWGGGQRALERGLAQPDGADSHSTAHAEGTVHDGDDAYVIPSAQRSWWGASVIDTAVQYAMGRGGLWHAHRENGAVTPSGVGFPYRHVYAFSNSKSRKGVTVTKYTERGRAPPSSTTTERGTAKALLIFNTHLDPTNDNRGIERQLDELRGVITRVIEAEADAYSNAGGDCGIGLSAVIVGDFNIDPTTSLYTRFVAGEWFDGAQRGGVGGHRGLVTVRELLSGASLSTHTYAKENPMVLWPCSAGRLDHIFAIDEVRCDEGDGGGAASRPGHKQEEGGLGGNRVIRLSHVRLVADSVIKAPVVSDHYPFTATLDL